MHIYLVKNLNELMAGSEYVIIPTYREAKNLRRLLPLLKRYNVIIVDDDSTDDTSAVCSLFKNVKLVTRNGKRGMASASLDGLRLINDKKARVVFMDADFEHDPSRLDEFFTKLGKMDFVVGVKSRRRPAFRKAVSWVGKQAAYTVLPGTKMLRDPMSCFFGVKLSAIDRASIAKLRVEPYGKLMLAMFESLKPGSKIQEIEYRYGNRKRGESSLNTASFTDYLKELLRLNNNRFMFFLLIGLVGIPINEGLAALFYPYLPLAYVFFAAISISTVINFIANHYITFRSRARFWKALAKFLAVTAVITGLTNFIVSLALSYFMFYLIANLFGIIMGFVVKYGLSEGFVWQQPGQRYKFVGAHR